MRAVVIVHVFTCAVEAKSLIAPRTFLHEFVVVVTSTQYTDTRSSPLIDG